MVTLCRRSCEIAGCGNYHELGNKGKVRGKGYRCCKQCRDTSDERNGVDSGDALPHKCNTTSCVRIVNDSRKHCTDCRCYNAGQSRSSRKKRKRKDTLQANAQRGRQRQKTQDPEQCGKDRHRDDRARREREELAAELFDVAERIQRQQEKIERAGEKLKGLQDQERAVLQRQASLKKVANGSSLEISDSEEENMDLEEEEDGMKDEKAEDDVDQVEHSVSGFQTFPLHISTANYACRRTKDSVSLRAARLTGAPLTCFNTFTRHMRGPSSLRVAPVKHLAVFIRCTIKTVDISLSISRVITKVLLIAPPFPRALIHTHEPFSFV